jgi:hypothetical protein
MTSPGDAAARPPKGFEGEVAGLGLTDIIQINDRNGFSGSIRVQNGDLRGVIFFRDGSVVHAEQGARTGEEAFCEMIGWQGGRFTVESNVVTAIRTIDKRCEHLLLDAHRVLDERRAREPRDEARPVAATRPAGASPAVEAVRAVAGVVDAVLLTRAGGLVGASAYQAEVLAGRSLFLGLVGAELGGAFDAGELRSASVEGSRRHLLLFNTKTHSLGVFAAPDVEVGAVDAGIRSALTKGR